MTAAPLLALALLPVWRDPPPSPPAGYESTRGAEAALEAALDAPLAAPFAVEDGTTLDAALGRLFDGTDVAWRGDRAALDLEGVRLDEMTLGGSARLPAGRFTVRAALEELLAGSVEIPLDSVNRGGVLLIAPEYEAVNRLITRHYPVRDLLEAAIPAARAGAFRSREGGGGTVYVDRGVAGTGAGGVRILEPVTVLPFRGDDRDGGPTPADVRAMTDLEAAVAARAGLKDLIVAQTGGPDRGGDWECDGGFGTIEAFNGTLVIRQTGEVHRQIAFLLADLRAGEAGTAWVVGGGIGDAE